MTTPEITLNNGVRIPQVGFGVYQIPEHETEAATTTALQAGYRHIDTASVYGNEAGVGAAVKSSAVGRENIFVTTKVWNGDQGYDATLEAFGASTQRLGLDVVDLLLIHWPVPKYDLYVQTWRAMIDMQGDGRVRAIGVSNFQPNHLRRLIDETAVVPAINQIELHPYLPQAELRAVHAELGIATEAWAPLARAGDIFEAPPVVAASRRSGKTPAQVVLRWQLQLGNVLIPKSVTPSRIAENIDIFDFELTDDEMRAIEALSTGERIGPDPDRFNLR